MNKCNPKRLNNLKNPNNIKLSKILKNPKYK